MSLTTRLGILISSEDFKRKIDRNVTGATLVRLDNKSYTKYKYLLYFSSHNGTYIRLAMSDSVTGPYRVTRHKIARMYFRRSIFRKNHVASPEIYRIANKSYLITHSPIRGSVAQYSFVGRLFFGRFVLRSRKTSLPSYLRLFEYCGDLYAIARKGEFFRLRPDLGIEGKIDVDLSMAVLPSRDDQTTVIRHPFVTTINNELICFYTRIGDAPERVLAAKITGLTDGMPRFGPALEILKPEETYEGADLTVTPSSKGRSRQPVNELRDPYIFQEGNKIYLFYSVRGEQGIALALIDPDLLLEQLKD